jgi:hypothetical protein
MRSDDLRGCRFAIDQAQWQAVRDVLLDRKDERGVLAAIIKLDDDGDLAFNLSGADPMYPVDHPHRRSVHQNRRECRVGFCQQSRVRGVLTS